MPSRIPPRPQVVDEHSAEHNYILKKLDGTDALIRARHPLIVEFDKSTGQYALKLASQLQGEGGGWDWMYPDHKELDSTLAYSKGKAAYISPNNDLVANGRFDPVALTMVTSVAGIWLCVKDVPTQTSTTYLGAAVYQYNLPQLPYPGATGTPTGSAGNLKGDLDGSNLYWVYLGQAPTCFGQ